MDTIIILTREQLHQAIQLHIDQFEPRCNLNHLDVSQCLDFQYAFGETRRRFNGDISKWKINKHANFHCMFHHSAFEGNISHWDLNEQSRCDGMFYGSSNLSDLSHWTIDINNARDMFKHSYNYSPLLWKECYDGPKHAIASILEYIGSTKRYINDNVLTQGDGTSAAQWQYRCLNMENNIVDPHASTEMKIFLQHYTKTCIGIIGHSISIDNAPNIHHDIHAIPIRPKMVIDFLHQDGVGLIVATQVDL